jgi:hypothetical protein
MDSRKPKKEKKTFNPQASYSWEPTDEFILTGLEIDKINKALAAAASDKDFQKNVVIYEGLLAFNQFFQTAVQEGAIKETPSEGIPVNDVPQNSKQEYIDSEPVVGEQPVLRVAE